jgi:DNA-binding GntR family transcriptional regulator
VAEITEKNLRDVLEVREALEELSVRLACDHITEDQIQELKQAAAGFQEVLKSGDVTKIAEADVQFHDIINLSTDNQKLIQILANLREQMYRYRIEYLKNEDVYPQLVKEHEQLIEAIAKKEKDKAADLVGQHIENQADAISVLIRTQKNGRNRG